MKKKVRRLLIKVASNAVFVVLLIIAFPPYILFMLSGLCLVLATDIADKTQDWQYRKLEEIEREE